MLKKIKIYADLVADLFHRGHVEFLKKAKAIMHNSYLVVGIHSDKDCTIYKRKPIFSMEDRIEIVNACKYVDEIIPNAPLEITQNFIKLHKIDLVVHGDDLTDFHININYRIPLKLGIMRTIPYYKGISSTEIINRIRSMEWEK
jgi:cytidyltransferase-like protein